MVLNRYSEPGRTSDQAEAYDPRGLSRLVGIALMCQEAKFDDATDHAAQTGGGHRGLAMKPGNPAVQGRRETLNRIGNLRSFVGSGKFRSFLTACAGFISLPIHNQVRSAPAWQVLSQGLQQQTVTLSCALVAAPQFVLRAHGINRPITAEDL
jgi:hypothetical protein